MNAPAQALSPAPGLPARAARHLRALLPTLDPAAALRLTFYLGGLLCFDGLMSRQIRNSLLIAAIVCVFAACLSILPAPRRRLHAYSPVLLVVGVACLPLLAGAIFHLTKLRDNTFLVAGIVLFSMACLSTLPPRLYRLFPYSRVLLAVALIGTLAAAGRGLLYIRDIPGILATPHHYQDDGLAATDCATQLFLHGHNPYTDFSLVDCFVRTGLTPNLISPMQAGAFAHLRAGLTPRLVNRVFQQARRHHVQRPAEFGGYFGYPAGSFLFPLPLLALGWHELGLFDLLCVLLAYLLLLWRAPPRLRPWLGPLALANLPVWTVWVQYGGRSNFLDWFLVLAAWATWRRSWLSALLLGAALTTSQNTWFFAPFYAILIGRTYGWRALAQRLAVMAAVFALINGPFVLQSPLEWLHGVLGPLRDPLFSTTDFGLTALAGPGWVPLWPRQVYTVLGLLAMAICALVYARICRRHPGAGLVLAVVPFLLAWRNFLGYFTPLTLFCLWPLLEDLRAAEVCDRGKVPQAGGEPTNVDSAAIAGR